MLAGHNAGFCIYDMPGCSTPLIATSDIAYIRFHGSRQLYSSCYSKEELAGWAKKIKSLGAGTVYVYFNNDAGGFAVGNALSLKHLLESA